MSVSIVPSEEAKAEAAEWLARLNKLDTPAEDLEAFRLWRKAPGNKEAYDQVDAFWRRSKGLQSDPDIQDAIAATLSKTSSAKPRRTAVTRPVLGLGFAMAALLDHHPRHALEG
jgi:transmembrane sensor